MRDDIVPGVLVSNLLKLLNLPVSINDSRDAALLKLKVTSKVTTRALDNPFRFIAHSFL